MNRSEELSEIRYKAKNLKGSTNGKISMIFIREIKIIVNPKIFYKRNSL